MNDNDKIEAVYKRVMNVVEESNRMVDAPNVPDMEQIQVQVKALVDEINLLPVEHRVAYADKFQELFDTLTTLEERLKGKRDEINAMLSDTDTHKKATSAYAKTDFIDKTPKE